MQKPGVLKMPGFYFGN